MTHPRRPAARRPGFTMVELLVVIALIATLAALSVGAVFRIRTAQQRSSTEATLQKLDTKLLEKLRQIEEQISEDVRLKRPGTGAGELLDAGFTSEQARSILMYARTKYQLPTTFAEANTPFIVGGITYNHPVLNDATHRKVLPHFAGLVGTGDINESAVLIYLALSQSGGGNEGLAQQIGDVTVSGSTQKCYLDAYGQPIAFIRLAYDGNQNEINTSPLTKNPAMDPFDPLNKTSAQLTATWALLRQPGYLCLNQNDAPVQCLVPPPAYRAAGTNRNHVSTLLSAGPNKKFADTVSVVADDWWYKGDSGSDNLLSYRLRKEGQKGD